MKASYLNLHKNHQLKDRSEKLLNMLSSCEICPRKCGVNRLENKNSYCKSGRYAIISSYGVHNGEEPPISGNKGSGTIFFGNCNLKCVFCQNHQISQEMKDTINHELTADKLANIMISLQNKGCHNINFVSPTHFIPQIVEALVIAVELGLNIPLVYNSGGYDDANTLRMLDGIFDIYMPDFKYGDSIYAEKYSDAKDYSKIAKNAIKEMYRQKGTLELNEDGIATKGLLIRHLILPENISGTNKVIDFIADELNKDTYVSLMSQYYPTYKASDDKNGECNEINRTINHLEYERAENYFYKKGLENGWIQELKESPFYYRPDFDKKAVFEDW